MRHGEVNLLKVTVIKWRVKLDSLTPGPRLLATKKELLLLSLIRPHPSSLPQQKLCLLPFLRVRLRNQNHLDSAGLKHKFKGCISGSWTKFAQGHHLRKVWMVGQAHRQSIFGKVLCHLWGSWLKWFHMGLTEAFSVEGHPKKCFTCGRLWMKTHLDVFSACMVLYRDLGFVKNFPDVFRALLFSDHR